MTPKRKARRMTAEKYAMRQIGYHEWICGDGRMKRAILNAWKAGFNAAKHLR